MSFDYDNYLDSGDFVKFTNVGDQIVGVIKEIREGKDFNGSPCPELILETEDGEEKTLTAGQVRLKALLAEKRPQVGDKVRITYSGVGAASPGKAPPKEFTVEVKAGPHEISQPAVVNDDSPF
jgi:hypothetical protein